MSTTRRPAPRRRPPASAVLAARWRLLTAAGRTSPEALLLAGTVLVLTVLGLVMTFSASFVASAAETGGAFDIFRRQLLWCLLGAPLLFGAARTDYRVWRPLAAPLLAVSLLAAALVLIPGVGVMVNGARRWIDLGPMRFQPTELLKLSVPLYLAHVLAARWPRLRDGDLRALVLPALPLLAVTGLLVMLEPDLETAALIVVIGAIPMYLAGLPGRLMAAGLGAGAVLGTAGILMEDFRRQRFAAWLNPMGHADTFGFQSVQGFIALGNGGWAGVGLGQGRGKWLYIPNAHTDFIFAIISEELGLLGALFVLTLFLALAVAGVRTARLAADPFGRLLAGAITGWLVLQAGMNMGSVVGLLPVTGVTLPMVSFGGSSLVFTMLGLGIL
ncbi:MAG TPA: putative lipid II flippase FtsW, partial [Egibacteraceae bacterium]|nr:putative lipid II flippase FtsW [Egibacteraceae bacterium]